MFTKANKAIALARVAPEAVSLAGKRVAVVGGTDGLGRAIAKAAAERGARVTVAGRTFRDEGVQGIDFVKADLSTVSEAKRLAAALPAPDLDVLVLTTGIMPGAKKVVSSEGVEIDMAVSALSRAVILKDLAAAGRLKKGGRIYVMGFPGAGQKGDPSDLNSDAKYEGGLGFTHMQTVAVNEALVHHWARALKGQGVSVFGLNPGLIQTGIRAGAMGGTLFGRIFEGVLGLFSITPETYARNSVLPLLVAPELPDHTGALFAQDGSPILPTPELVDEAYVARFMQGLDELQARAEAAGAAGKA